MPVALEFELNKYGILAWCMLFSLLFDPEPDGEFKIPAHSPPFHPDTVFFSNDEWLAIYRIMDSGDINVGYISDAPDL
ncbi:MAG: hypothetical protein F4Y44_10635 [Chloroflexi bacterium]|nr:hypothetical protein [Chloroflexota bacterium]